jgi:hypothetical protein
MKRATAAALAGIGACIAVGAWVGREIDRAIRTIGR